METSPQGSSKENEFQQHFKSRGSSKAISDEDKRGVVITEAPSALKQLLSMHLASLKTYLDVRDVVVSYLQAKRVWTPNATYAGSTARKDPNAMDIGKIGLAPSPHAVMSVRKIGEHRLLVVREHMQVSHNAILAQVSPTSQQAISHFGT